jgi:hypothetical protein
MPAENYFVLTVDVDADANRAAHGRAASVSASAAEGESAFRAAAMGTARCLAICEELGLASTWFLEGRTVEAVDVDWSRYGKLPWFEAGCHGLNHEDFTGAQTGVHLTTADCTQVVRDATRLVQGFTGVRPKGFRAPYNSSCDHLRTALVRCGYEYHSSVSRTVGRGRNPFRPYVSELPGGRRITEVPIPRIRDRTGGLMSCYMWPFFEGRREIEAYLWFVEESMRLCEPPRLIQLALHPWHLGVTADGEYVARPVTERLAAELTWLMVRIEAMDGLECVTMGQFLGMFPAEG